MLGNTASKLGIGTGGTSFTLPASIIGKDMLTDKQTTDKNESEPRSSPSARTFSRRSLHGQVAHDIGRRILGGLVKPGELLPSETELSQRLGVSRTALREAIKVLAGKGLIESRPKTGTRVRPRETWNFLDPDVLTWAFDGNTPEHYVDELYELRRVISQPGRKRLEERDKCRQSSRGILQGSGERPMSSRS